MTEQVSHTSNLETKMNRLKEEGYVLFEKALDHVFLEEMLKRIKKCLKACAQDLSCSYEEYMSSVSRWVDPSPVTEEVSFDILKKLKDFLEPFTGKCDLAKLNLISKTPFSSASLPFHQDISYSPSSP